MRCSVNNNIDSKAPLDFSKRRKSTATTSNGDDAIIKRSGTWPGYVDSFVFHMLLMK